MTDRHLTTPAAGPPANGAPSRSGPLLLGVRHHGPGSARAVRAALEHARPDVRARSRDRRRPTGSWSSPPTRGCGPRWRCSPTRRTTRAAPRSGRSPSSRPSGSRSAGPLEQGVPVRFIDLPAAHTLAWATTSRPRTPVDAGADEDEEEAAASTRSARSPRPRATTTPSGGGRTPSRHRFGSAGRAGGDAEAPEPAAASSTRRTAGVGTAASSGGRVASAEGRGRAPGRATAPALTATPGARGEHLGAGGERPGTSGEQHGSDSDCRRLGASRQRRARALSTWEDAVGAPGGRWVPGGRWRPVAPFEALGEAMAGAARGLRRRRARPGPGPRGPHAAPTARGAQGVRRRQSPWSAAPGTCPRSPPRATVAADRPLLKGLPKVKAEITWVPWTHRRLARRQRIRRGHRLTRLVRAPVRRAGPARRALDDEGRRAAARRGPRPSPPAHVIEAVRLAETLAAMRGRPLAGLTETTDAVRAVMCDGSDVPLALVHDQLVVGDVLGEVPEAAPAVPLQRDLTRPQRGLRLKPEALERELDLDLRKETDAARSRLLHRLRLLGIGWGEPTRVPGEHGHLPGDLAAALGAGAVRAGGRGRGLGHDGAGARPPPRRSRTRSGAAHLAEVTALAERCLLAGLPDALPGGDAGARRPGGAGHGRRPSRPGPARAGALAAVRGCAGHGRGSAGRGRRRPRRADLRGPAAGLRRAGRRRRRARCGAIWTPCTRRWACWRELDTPADRPLTGADPAEPIRRRAGRRRGASPLAGVRGDGTSRAAGARSSGTASPGSIRGRCVRLLLDDGQLGDEEAARLMGLALSPGTRARRGAPPGSRASSGGARAAACCWCTTTGSSALVDAWLTGVPADAFTDVLPLLRRTFAAYEPGVRRTLGELVRRGPGRTGTRGSGGAGAPGSGVDSTRSGRTPCCRSCACCSASPGAGERALRGDAARSRATRSRAARHGTSAGTTHGSELMEVTG